MKTRVKISKEDVVYIRTNLKQRISEQIDYFVPVMPERHVIAWRAYLAALFEWGVIEFGEYDELLNLLPTVIEPNPVSDIFIFEPAIADGAA